MQSLDDRYQAFALTDKSGNSKVRACFDYEGDRFVTVVHPEIDPQFFAEVKLNSNDQPLAEVRLQRAVEIEGILTFNDRPIAHGLVRAVPIRRSLA